MTRTSVDNPDLPRLAVIYNTMCELEEDTHLNSLQSKKYINLLLEAEVIMERNYDGYGLTGLIKERKRHEDDFAREGKLHAIDVNLGARTYVHITCIEFNLFLITEGWISVKKDGKLITSEHWVVGSDTLCHLSGVEYQLQPSWRNHEPCVKCMKAIFKRRVLEIIEAEPRVPEKYGSSLSGYGIDITRIKGMFELRSDSRSKKVIMTLPDIGYGKMSEKEWNKRF